MSYFNMFLLFLELVLNIVSIVLDLTGVGAAFSWIPDVILVVLALLQKDWFGLLLSLFAAIPFVGIAGNAAKILRIIF